MENIFKVVICSTGYIFRYLNKFIRKRKASYGSAPQKFSADSLLDSGGGRWFKSLSNIKQFLSVLSPFLSSSFSYDQFKFSSGCHLAVLDEMENLTFCKHHNSKCKRKSHTAELLTTSCEYQLSLDFTHAGDLISFVTLLVTSPVSLKLKICVGCVELHFRVFTTPLSLYDVVKNSYIILAYSFLFVFCPVPEVWGILTY